MKPERKQFFIDGQIEWQELGPGLKRKVMAYDNQIMMVKMSFGKGAVGATHSHFHAQTTYIVSGRFDFTIGDTTQTVNAGDSIYIEPNAVHGLVCLDEGVVIDNFSPMREDFV